MAARLYCEPGWKLYIYIFLMEISLFMDCWNCTAEEKKKKNSHHRSPFFFHFGLDGLTLKNIIIKASLVLFFFLI